MEFSILDNLTYSFLYLLTSQYVQFLFIPIMCVLIFSKNRKFTVFFLSSVLLIFFFAALGFREFSKKVCQNYFSLDVSQCQITFEPKPDSKENFVFLKISRNFDKKYQNGYFLGKKDPSFEVKQEHFYIKLKKDYLLVDNEGLIFLQLNKQELQNKVNNFLSFKDVK